MIRCLRGRACRRRTSPTSTAVISCLQTIDRSLIFCTVLCIRFWYHSPAQIELCTFDPLASISISRSAAISGKKSRNCVPISVMIVRGGPVYTVIQHSCIASHIAFKMLYVISRAARKLVVSLARRRTGSPSMNVMSMYTFSLNRVFSAPNVI